MAKSTIAITTTAVVPEDIRDVAHVTPGIQAISSRCQSASAGAPHSSKTSHVTRMSQKWQVPAQVASQHIPARDVANAAHCLAFRGDRSQ